MLRDAIAAEAFRLKNNKSVSFWGFAFIPLALLVFNLGLDTYMRVRVGTGVGFDLSVQIARALGLSGASFVQIFFALGAAAIFAGDYRWETWRLIAPRNSRTNLMLGKFAVYTVATALSLLALGAMGLVHGLYGSVLSGTMPLFPPMSFLVQVVGVFASSLLELLLIGAFVALIAVTSRAMIGASIAGIMFAFIQSVAMTQLSLADTSILKLAIVPRFAAETLDAFTAGRQIGPNLFAAPSDAALAAIFLTAWILVLGAAALLYFRRQDLSRE